jgi:hypothetical protein
MTALEEVDLFLCNEPVKVEPLVDLVGAFPNIRQLGLNGHLSNKSYRIFGDIFSQRFPKKHLEIEKLRYS